MECYTAVGLINWLNYFYVEIFFATDYRKRFLLKLAVFFQCSVFNRATRMHRARTMLWQDVCPSLCLSSVCHTHTPVCCRNGYRYPQSYFTIGYSPTILVFPYQTRWQYSDGDPVTGASNARGYKKSRFSTNLALFRK